MTEPLRGEARTILETLSLMPFEECYLLSREFQEMPTCPGLYAIRHRDEGMLVHWAGNQTQTTV